jgi:hypothetical protein
MRFGWMVCFVFVGGCCFGSKYDHKLLLSGANYNLSDGYLNENGQTLLSARVGNYFGLYFDGQDYSASIAHNGLYSRGLNAHGDVAWDLERADGRWNVMLDASPIATGLSNVTTRKLTNTGHVLWDSLFDSIGYTFIDRENQDDKYQAYDSFSGGLNDSGQMLWVRQTLPDAHYGVFINNKEVSGGVYGPDRRYSATQINAHGSYVWQGAPPVEPYHQHVWLNMTDITKKYVGDFQAQAGAVLNENDQVLWCYADAMSRVHVMRDGFDVSAIAGNDVALEPEGLAMNDLGSVLWKSGSHNLLPERVWVDNYDLTGDLFPDRDYGDVRGLALNNKGQVLWYANVNGKLNYYLSTPVPEPGSIIAVTAALTVFLRKPKGYKPNPTHN